MRNGVISLLLLLLSAVAGWWAGSLLFGGDSGWRLGGALVAVFAAAHRASGWGFMAVGCLTLGALIVPAMLFTVGALDGEITPFGIPLTFSSAAIIGLALVVAAALVYGAMTRDVGRFVLLAVAGLLLAVGFYAVFWLMVWDSTYDPIGMILLPFLALVAVLAGGALMVYLPRQKKAAGLLFVLLVPASLILVAAAAQHAGYRAITHSRAERVSHALERYHAREGQYPQSLGQLPPRDALFVPRPVVLFGQEWCYEGGGDAYQLGYVDREHWSDPRLMARVYKTAGDVAGLGSLCAAEIDELIGRFPDFFEFRE